MICQDHPARACAQRDVQVVRIADDFKARPHRLCADCRAHYLATFGHRFVAVAS